MIKKYYAWHAANREEIDVACVLIVLATIIYCVFFALNWALVSFLSFTKLKWLVYGVVGYAVGNTLFAFNEGRDIWNKMEKEDDGPGFL